MGFGCYEWDAYAISFSFHQLFIGTTTAPIEAAACIRARDTLVNIVNPCNSLGGSVPLGQEGVRGERVTMRPCSDAPRMPSAILGSCAWRWLPGRQRGHCTVAPTVRVRQPQP